MKIDRAFTYVFGMYGAAMSVLAAYNSKWLYVGVYGLMALIFGILNIINNGEFRMFSNKTYSSQSIVLDPLEELSKEVTRQRTEIEYLQQENDQYKKLISEIDEYGKGSKTLEVESYIQKLIREFQRAKNPQNKQPHK
ncbi:hypothetical protein MOD67_13835 [Bacillus licheniformis]|uniref:hypothetical protein n=1 Tax=Bacillus TaxID=1386 RepID=UPI00228245A6|nr:MULTISPECIES: hypothetical protein [Bacillus]MCY7861102.1 hypothetical protein [Bacillus haynesii]MCY8015569.1 hypothetical protein [Bacillus haynesii]MCY8291568.1 hypothetical protein [Bacillus haynesii]MCY8549192.1 hypothetical protein [Bacillus haynesii]MCY8745061.1 hypothetical protein [Bacillus licheniformis]